MAKGKKSKGNHKTSSGNRKTSEFSQQLRRTQMKIKRWKRYQEEIKAGTRKGKLKRWDTTGLEKHSAWLEGKI